MGKFFCFGRRSSIFHLLCSAGKTLNRYVFRCDPYITFPKCQSNKFTINLARSQMEWMCPRWICERFILFFWIGGRAKPQFGLFPSVELCSYGKNATGKIKTFLLLVIHSPHSLSSRKMLSLRVAISYIWLARELDFNWIKLNVCNEDKCIKIFFFSSICWIQFTINCILQQDEVWKIE
jgi:hypothetical protein